MVANPQEFQILMLSKEVERLNKLVEELRLQRDTDRAALETLQEERKKLMQYLCARAREHYPPELLEQWANEEPEDGVPLSEFIDELERIADEHAPGKWRTMQPKDEKFLKT